MSLFSSYGQGLRAGSCSSSCSALVGVSMCADEFAVLTLLRFLCFPFCFFDDAEDEDGDAEDDFFFFDFFGLGVGEETKLDSFAEPERRDVRLVVCDDMTASEGDG